MKEILIVRNLAATVDPDGSRWHARVWQNGTLVEEYWHCRRRMAVTWATECMIHLADAAQTEQAVLAWL